MSVSYEAFVAEFPQFAETERPIVEAKLQEATRYVAADIWGDKTDEGIKYRAAHLIECSPFGRGARLNKNNGATTYSDVFDELRLAVAPKAIVT